MKFRTEIEVAPWQQKIEYGDTVVCLGSCFASNIGERLAERKFSVSVNPTGILFNPASIANAIERIEAKKLVTADDVFNSDGRWLSYDFHSSLSGTTEGEAVDVINRQIASSNELLKRANYLIITLGTAWVYRLCSSGKVVANCHKQPHSAFRRELMSVAEIVDSLERIISCTTAHIVLTVSPIRHLGEGLADNSLSKALLRVAVEEFRKRHAERITYFPSYEIMLDDLRDYRFYGDDLVHPTKMAVDYIAERFFEAALSSEAKQKMEEVTKIINAANHRAQNPHSEQHRLFCQKQLEAINRIKDIDLQKEREHFEQMLQINL